MAHSCDETVVLKVHSYYDGNELMVHNTAPYLAQHDAQTQNMEPVGHDGMEA